MSDSASTCSSPASFIDDGVDFESRIPRGGDSYAWNIPQWVNGIGGPGPGAVPTTRTQTSVADDSSTVIAQSFIDDGADLLVPEGAGPAIGRPNPEYYRDPAPRNQNRSYHPGVQRAVDGQIKNMLRAGRALGKIRVVGADGKTESVKRKEKEEEKKEERRKGVKVFMPPQVPNFVIHGEGGHVIVVDGDEEPIDSRPPPEFLNMKRGRPAHAHGAGEKGKAGHNRKETEKKKQQQQSKEKVRNQQEMQTASHFEATKTNDKNDRSHGRPPSNSNPDPFLMSGGLGFPFTHPSKTSLTDHAAEDTKSNYKPPTVEDAVDTPVHEKRTYLNGYDEPYETYCNANWGGIPVRVGQYVSPWTM